LITVIKEQLPFNIFSKTFRNEIVGRKILYHDVEHTITSFIDGQCCIMIDTPYKDEEETKIDIIASLNSGIIDWYPELDSEEI
jgi:hypothetical protein